MNGSYTGYYKDRTFNTYTGHNLNNDTSSNQLTTEQNGTKDEQKSKFNDKQTYKQQSG